MKSGQRVFRELYEKHWMNDTLSPISLRPYQELANKLINDNEIIYSALLGQVNALKLAKQDILIVATNKGLKISRQTGDYRLKNLLIPYSQFRDFDLFTDTLNKRRYYAILKYRVTGLRPGTKCLRFEVLDISGAIHFEKTVQQIVEKLKSKALK